MKSIKTKNQAVINMEKKDFYIGKKYWIVDEHFGEPKFKEVYIDNVATKNITTLAGDMCVDGCFVFPHDAKGIYKTRGIFFTERGSHCDYPIAYFNLQDAKDKYAILIKDYIDSLEEKISEISKQKRNVNQKFSEIWAMKE